MRSSSARTSASSTATRRLAEMCIELVDHLAFVKPKLTLGWLLAAQLAEEMAVTSHVQFPTERVAEFLQQPVLATNLRGKLRSPLASGTP